MSTVLASLFLSDLVSDNPELKLGDGSTVVMTGKTETGATVVATGSITNGTATYNETWNDAGFHNTVTHALQTVVSDLNAAIHKSIELEKYLKNPNK